MPTFVPSCCDIKDLLQGAWRATLDEDPHISTFLRHGVDWDAYERAIAFRIGRHLAEDIERLRHGWRWSSSTVDMELHRRTGGDLKVPSGARPDLVVHVRGRDDGNLVAIEFKASSNQDIEQLQKDRRTLHALVHGSRQYLHGVRAVFNVESELLLLRDWLHLQPTSGCAAHAGFTGTKSQYVRRPPSTD